MTKHGYEVSAGRIDPEAAAGDPFRMGAEIRGARLHRAGHVGNVPHNQYVDFTKGHAHFAKGVERT